MPGLFCFGKYTSPTSTTIGSRAMHLNGRTQQNENPGVFMGNVIL